MYIRKQSQRQGKKDGRVEKQGENRLTHTYTKEQTTVNTTNPENDLNTAEQPTYT